MTAPPATAAAQPLHGTRIVVTRAKRQANALTERLSALGASVIELPTIEIVPAPAEPIDEALERLDSYDWVIFTSVNGVDAVVPRWLAMGRDWPSNTRVAAIGPATQRRLTEARLAVDFLPERFVAESVVEGMTALGVQGKRVLLARADIARNVLPDGLRAAGVTVDVVVAYRTARPDTVDPELLDDVRAGRVGLLTFASPSTVRNLTEVLGGSVVTVPTVCIGPITTAAARDCGFDVVAEASEYTIPGLVEAVIAVVARGGGVMRYGERERGT